MRPDFGEVEDIVAELFGLFWGHCLLGEELTRDWREKCSTYEVDRPAGVVALLDALKESLRSIVRVLAGEFTSLGISKSLLVMNDQRVRGCSI